MRRVLLTTLLSVLAFGWLQSQTVILDFETEETSTVFQYFGGTQEGTFNRVIANPAPDAVNETDSVAEWVKAAGAPVWAGGFTNPQVPGGIDLTAGGQICMDVWMDHIGNFAIKLEQSPTAGDWILTAENTVVNAWEQICFDLSEASIEAPFEVAEGNVFNQLVLFADFGTEGGAEDETYYIDELVHIPAPTENVILDFETEETSTVFQYFGGTQEGTFNRVLANPAPDAVNETDSVAEWVKAAGAPVWAGGFTNPQVPGGIDLTAGGQICMDVWMDHIGNFAIKLEQSSTTGDWILTAENTVVNAWEQICFDLSEASIEAPFEVAAGNVFNQLVLFADFGTEGGAEDETYYIDEIIHIPAEYTETVYYDQEDTSTTGFFQYFGSRLEPQLTEVIPNPNPTGVNTSDNVIQYVKPEDAQTWAGAFANPAPTTPIDASNGGMFCLQVHMDHIGNVALKLEQSSTGGEDWIFTVENTKVNEWEELCFPFDSNSLEMSMLPATGHIYNQIVVFPDFGTAGNGTDSTIYYLDNFTSLVPVSDDVFDITFELNMNEYADAFTQPYVSGEFNNWCGDCNPMEDPDGDNIWTTTIALPGGPVEYKFTLDDWAVQEEFDGLEECTTTDPSGQFINRILLVSSVTDTQSYCWNSCYKCDESATITINLNTALIDQISPDGIFLAGGEAFGHGDFPMSDDDGDGIWSITIERALGFSSDYTFINGICLPDWGCKENIAGQDCAVQPFNDRRLEPLTEDIVINTCFGACTDDGTCPDPNQEYEVTFNVDMNDETVAGGVFLAGGTINGWDPTATQMSDDDGDGIYTVSVMLQEGLHEFKFVNGETFETLMQGEPCTITDPSGEFTNRLLLLEPADTTLAAVKFGSCELSTSNKDLYIDETLYELRPTLVSDMTTLTWNTDELAIEQVEVVTLDGRVVQEQIVDGQTGHMNIDMSSLSPGMYVIMIQSERKIGLKKVMRMR